MLFFQLFCPPVQRFVDFLLNCGELSDDIEEGLFIHSVHHNPSVRALVSEVLSADLPEADLTLQVYFYALHTKVQLLHVRRKGFIEEPGLVLAQSQVDEKLSQVKSLFLYKNVEDGAEFFRAIQILIVD